MAERTKPAELRKKQIQAKKTNQPGRPTAGELERRKAIVMQVATELFVTRGYVATSLVDIARSAGVATRTLYQHFGDKEALFREVIFARDSIGVVEKPVLVDGDTLFTALLRVGNYAYDVTYRDQAIGLMRLMIAESARFPDFMQQVAISIFGRFQSNIEKVFIALQQAGAIPRGDHARSAELLVDILLGSHPIMTYTNWDSTRPSEKDLQGRIEFFIKGRFGEKVARTAKRRKIRLKSGD